MVKVTLEFTGQARDINEFGFALFEAESLGQGSQKEIPGGGTLTMGPMIVRKAHGIPQVITVLLSVGTSVGAGIASNYIYDKLKEHGGEKLTITINRREARFEGGEIKTIIEEEIKIKKT